MIFAMELEGEAPSRIRMVSGINVHHCTSIYISRNEVERRLGTNAVVQIASILLTFSQFTLLYIVRHPHPSASSSQASQ
jgi:hypothetical protein